MRLRYSQCRLDEIVAWVLPVREIHHCKRRKSCRPDEKVRKKLVWAGSSVSLIDIRQPCAVSHLENCTRIILNEPLTILAGEEFLNVILGGLSTFAVSSTALSSIRTRHFMSRSRNVAPSDPLSWSNLLSLLSTSVIYLVKPRRDRFVNKWKIRILDWCECCLWLTFSQQWRHDTSKCWTQYLRGGVGHIIPCKENESECYIRSIKNTYLHYYPLP